MGENVGEGKRISYQQSNRDKALVKKGINRLHVFISYVERIV